MKNHIKQIKETNNTQYDSKGKRLSVKLNIIAVDLE